MATLKWIIPSVLAAGHHPLRNSEFNLTTEPDFYTKNGIKSVISVFEIPIDVNILKCLPWEYYFQPTQDGDAPKNLYKICQAIANNNGTFVHCWEGTGRTATVLVAYMIYGGYADTVKEAILHLRKTYHPNVIHTAEQYLGLLEFAGEYKPVEEVEEELDELIKKNHKYSGKRKYELLLYVAKQEMKIIKEKFGLKSDEYKASRRKVKKFERAVKTFN